MYYGTFPAFSREMFSGEIVHILKNFGLIFKNAGIGGFHLRDARKSFMVWRLGCRSRGYWFIVGFWKEWDFWNGEYHIFVMYCGARRLICVYLCGHVVWPKDGEYVQCIMPSGRDSWWRGKKGPDMDRWRTPHVDMWRPREVANREYMQCIKAAINEYLMYRNHHCHNEFTHPLGALLFKVVMIRARK
jgi:hypothetical protein